jgi:GntR family transcriptional regulator
MLFDIEHDSISTIPIYERIINKVTFAIASGSLQVGERIPSVRELAGRLNVHPNTVAKAFQILEERRLLVARRGLGMEVTAEAPALCRTQRQQIVRTRIKEALREAVSSALSADEIRRLVEEELSRANGQVRQGAGETNGE